MTLQHSFKTTAPAPSPNNTQVLRSVQSTSLETHSAPMTKAHFASPRRMNLSAMLMA